MAMSICETEACIELNFVNFSPVFSRIGTRPPAG
jgi:hypothetical protein